jgi:hypothetical protein
VSTLGRVQLNSLSSVGLISRLECVDSAIFNAALFLICGCGFEESVAGSGQYWAGGPPRKPSWCFQFLAAPLRADFRKRLACSRCSRVRRPTRSSHLAEWHGAGGLSQSSVDQNHAPRWPFGVLGFLAGRLRGWPFEVYVLQPPRRVAARTSHRGRDSPDSTIGVGIILDSLPEWSKGSTQSPFAQAVWAQIPRLSCFCYLVATVRFALLRVRRTRLPASRRSLAEWSKALASAVSPQGHGIGPRSCIRGGIGLAFLDDLSLSFSRLRQP